MSGLNTAIRAKLDGWLDDICGDWCGGCPIDDHDAAIRMRAALIAVLDSHLPLDTEYIDADGGARWSTDCTECDNGGVPYNWPCPTVRAIAQALGVEADHA